MRKLERRVSWVAPLFQKVLSIQIVLSPACPYTLWFQGEVWPHTVLWSAPRPESKEVEQNAFAFLIELVSFGAVTDWSIL